MSWLGAALYVIGAWVGISLLCTVIWCLWVWKGPVVSEDWRGENGSRPSR